MGVFHFTCSVSLHFSGTPVEFRGAASAQSNSNADSDFGICTLTPHHPSVRNDMAAFIEFLRQPFEVGNLRFTPLSLLVGLGMIACLTLAVALLKRLLRD